MTDRVRNVVLGAGAMGSATAYHLARRGEPVVLVEQFALGHDRGSSHGSARIARHSYADPAYARLMVDAFQAWRELEADAGQPLFLRTGGISISPASTGYVGQVAASLGSIGVTHRVMSGADLNRALPVFGVPGDMEVVFEPDAGMIAASRAIVAQIDLARKSGGEQTVILDQTPVRHLDLDGDRPRLILDDRVIEADRLVVAAGAWTGRLLPDLAGSLRPTRQQVLYFRPDDPGPFELGRLPTFISMGVEDGDAWYGMPRAMGMGVKVARHGGPDVDPDFVDRGVENDYRARVREFLARTIPSLADSPIDREEVCLYTMAEQERFRLGFLPEHPAVIVASPCSGHGFKFSCLIGRILAELATEGRTSVEMSPWRIG